MRGEDGRLEGIEGEGEREGEGDGEGIEARRDVGRGVKRRGGRGRRDEI